MFTRHLGIISLLSLIGTSLWVVLTIAGVATAGPTHTFELLLNYVSKQSLFYTLAYINAVLITLLVTALYAGLGVYLQHFSSGWSSIALVFVPVYAVLNLGVYLTQVTLVPMLIGQPGGELFLKLSIHLWPESLAFLLNTLAYAVLGIPSIIFACLMWRINPIWQLGSAALVLNGVACWVGLGGLVFKNAVLANGSTIGGMFFLLALIAITWALLRQGSHKAI